MLLHNVIAHTLYGDRIMVNKNQKLINLDN